MKNKNFFFILLFLLVLPISFSIQNDFLIAEYLFDVNDTGDTSGKQNDLTDNGCNRDATDSIMGSASLVCTGTNYMGMANNLFDYGAINNGTVSTWIKYTTRSSVDTLFGDWASSQGLSFFAESSGGFASYFLYPNNFRVEPGSHDMDSKAWELYTLMWNNTEATLFINGSKTDNVTITNGLGNSIGNFRIACRGDGSCGVAGDDVNFDTFCVWNTSLSGEEIVSLYNGGSGNSCLSALAPTPNVVVNHDMTNTSNINSDFNISYNMTVTNSNLEIFECNLFNSSSIYLTNPTANASQNNIFEVFTSGISEDFIFSISCSADDNLNSTNFSIDRGTYNFGLLNSTYENDEDLLSLSEQTGVMGFNITFNYSSVQNFDRVHLEYNYTGSVGHIINLAIYNFSSTVFDILTTLSSGFHDIEQEVPTTTDYISNSEVMLLIEHTNAGNVNHNFEIDNINLEIVNFSDNTTTHLYQIDAINPEITTNFVNGSNFTESDTIDVYFNYTDLNLLVANLTVFNNTNSTFFNVTLLNITTTFSMINLSTLLDEFGNFTIKAESWDSHTSVNIPNYKWDKYSLVFNNVTYKGISFNNNKFNLSSPDSSILDEFELIKKPDRFQMKFVFNTLQEFTLYMDTEKRIYYLPNSDYIGHFVIGNHWLDFDSSDITNLNIKYKDNLKVWEIKFTPINNEVIFNSIGDLNYLEQTYNFQVFQTETVITPIVNLTGVENALSGFSDNFNMVWILFFVAIFIFAGIITRFWALWSISAVGFFLMAMNYLRQYNLNGLPYQKAVIFIFLFLGVGMFLTGITLQILQIFSEKKQDKKDFYNLNY